METIHITERKFYVYLAIVIVMLWLAFLGGYRLGFTAGEKQEPDAKLKAIERGK
jgi:hypothetical protein